MDSKENLNKNTQTKRVIGIVLGVSLLLIIVRISYAFLPTDNVRNEPVDATASTATLKLKYTDCTNADVSTCGDISADLGIGESITKEFSVSNVGTKDVNYTIYFRELSNTFVKDELVYKLENLTSGEVVIPETPVSRGTNDGEELLTDVTSTVGSTTRYRLTITFLNKDYDQRDNAEAEFSMKLGIKEPDACKRYKTTTLANGLKVYDSSATTYNECNSSEMYVFDHDELTTTTEYNGTTYTHSATQVADWTSEQRRDYRYIGANPNNYVTFNDEAWRIIGVFTVETESGEKKPLMKIIRDQSIGDLAWDSNNVNEWSTASLQQLLNGDYYNQTGSYTDTASVKGLSSTARLQIAKVKWYLGGSSTYRNLGGSDYYNFERGETTCVTAGTCSGKTRTTSIIANIGLMYPSDYVYTYGKGVNDTCYTDGYNCDSGTPSAGWLFNNASQWTILPYAANAVNAFNVYNTGYVDSSGVYRTNGVRPTVFLDSKIAIKSGDGSQENPYVIG